MTYQFILRDVGLRLCSFSRQVDKQFILNSLWNLKSLPILKAILAMKLNESAALK